MTLHDIDIASLIPHAGSMCLLDCIIACDEHNITCRATRHRDTLNPLRHNDRLSIHAGIEYAAQAVAAHGGWLARQHNDSAPPRQGVIAVLTDVRWQTERLDTVADDIAIHAEKLADLPQGLHYRFTLGDGKDTLLTGEMIIALQPLPLPTEAA